MPEKDLGRFGASQGDLSSSACNSLSYVTGFIRKDQARYIRRTIKAKHVNILYGPMPLRKYPRIEIDQRAYDALQAEGILQHRTVREIATDAILDHISIEAIEFIDRRTTRPNTTSPEDITTERPQDHRTNEEKEGAGAVDDLSQSKPQKRQKLTDNPDALAKIKMLWQGGEHNAAQIAKDIGYARGTVWENIKKMKAKGELTSE